MNTNESNLLVIANKESDKFAIISLHCLLNKNLSWKAKGVHQYFRSRPNVNWRINFNALKSISTDGEVSLRAGINELIEHHYLYRVPIRDKKNIIRKWYYISLPEPIILSEEEIKKLYEENKTGTLDYPQLENPKLDVPLLDTPVYSNIEYSNIECSVLSKDNTKNDSDESFSAINSQEVSIGNKNNTCSAKAKSKLPYLSRWNSLNKLSPNSPCHRENSKTHSQIDMFCKALKKGTFFSKRTLDKEWMKMNNIPNEAITKKWTNAEIFTAFRYLALSFSYDYPPEQKYYLRRSLPALIYNPKSCKSWFLSVFYNHPVKFAEQIQDKYPTLTKIFLPLFNGNMTIKDKKALARGVASIAEFYNKLNLDEPRVKYKFRNPISLCNEFLIYLQKEVHTQIYPTMISAKVKTWNDFINYMNYMMSTKEIGYNLLK